ncbi:peptidoglycan-binding protein [Mycolicibacterium sp.]|uniref:peptidoglycan-binding domain-containing protein n=1 Tax=Mycolicibacterium sp. TaxID=2320850 RepID=UPI00356492F9
MPVLRVNVDYFWSIAKPRNRKPYGYGGVWVPHDVNRTTDCSGIVTHALDACINGPSMKWSRHGISTEAYRYVGDPKLNPRGPFGTIRVAHWRDIPTDAAVKIGLQHGPGGGANSHMACTIEGVSIESRGGSVANGGGQWIGGNARAYNNPLFHDWFYLPGPIIGSGTVTPPPATAPGSVYLGRNCARYECSGDRVKALQERLNRDYPAYSDLAEDGEFGPLTEAVVREFQRRSFITIDGIAGPATLAALRLSFQPQEVPNVALTDRELLEKIAADTAEIRAQLGTGHPDWPPLGDDKQGRPLTLRNAVAKALGVDI